MRHAETRNTQQATKAKRRAVKEVRFKKSTSYETRYDIMFKNYLADVRAGLFPDDDNCSYWYEEEFGMQIGQQEENRKDEYIIRLAPCRRSAKANAY